MEWTLLWWGSLLYRNRFIFASYNLNLAYVWAQILCVAAEDLWCWETPPKALSSVNHCAKIHQHKKYNYTLLRNSFQANVQFLYPLKTSENLRFPDVFRGCRNETMAWKGLLQQLQANSLMKQLSSRIWKIKKQLKVFSCFCQKNLNISRS